MDAKAKIYSLLYRKDGEEVTVKQLAEMFGLSTAYVSRVLRILSAKLGVRIESRKEGTTVYYRMTHPKRSYK